MSNMIEASFPGRPGLSLKASAILSEPFPSSARMVPGDEGEEALYWVRVEQEEFVVWEAFPQGRAFASAIAGGAIYRLMRGCSVEGLEDPDFEASLADLRPVQEEALASAGAWEGRR